MPSKNSPTTGPWVAEKDRDGVFVVRGKHEHVVIADVWSRALRSEQDMRLQSELVAEQEINARLIEAAGTAAHEVQRMGFDPVEAVKALPEILSCFTWIEDKEADIPPEPSPFNPDIDRLKEALMRAAAKEGTGHE